MSFVASITPSLGSGKLKTLFVAQFGSRDCLVSHAAPTVYREEAKHPSFSSVLYALRTFNHIHIKKGKIYTNANPKVSCDQEAPPLL